MMKYPSDRPGQGSKPISESSRSDLQGRLIQLARDRGAHDAAIINVKAIGVEDRLADLCRQPGCANYGLAAGCPPHVGGPAQFRQWQKAYHRAILIRIDVPTAILLSEKRRDVFRRLHDIAASIEQTAVDSGFTEARAFAGGSCKELFCADQPTCRVINESGPCRHPDRARPSMSGFGIDVSRLMAAAGWKMNRITRTTKPDAVPTGPITALVLID
jgi:predicted metal-binding protein